MKTVKTLDSKMAPADICRANGWGVGTVICGDKFDSMPIEITAVGKQKILGHKVGELYETAWDLKYQEWSEVK